MKNIEDLVAELEKHKDRLKKQYKVSRLGILGGEKEDKESEEYVDILVEFKGPVGLEFVDLSSDLEVILNEKVHLITKSGIQSKYLKKVRKDIIYI